jgi:hypothetical protein
MLDAADLARAISECRSLEEAVRTYEEAMFARAERTARGADEGLKKAIAPDAATHIPPVFRQQMSTAPAFLPRTRREAFAESLTVRVDEQGNGRPILILHGAAGPQSVSGLASGLAVQAHVLVPTHPGFEGEPRPEWFNSVDDLAFTYLDLLEMQRSAGQENRMGTGGRDKRQQNASARELASAFALACSSSWLRCDE